MKRRLTTALLSLVLLSTACSKEKKFCWKCVMYKANSMGVMDFTRPYESAECDKTEDQIRAHEEANTKTVRVYSGDSYSTKTVQAMICNLNQ